MFFENSGNIVILKQMFDFIKNIGSTELIVLVLILVLLFGARAAVGFGKTSGEAVKELKKIKKEFSSAVEDDRHEPSKT